MSNFNIMQHKMTNDMLQSDDNIWTSKIHISKNSSKFTVIITLVSSERSIVVGIFIFLQNCNRKTF